MFMQVFIKDCISSDLTSFVTSSGDVAAGFTGEADQEFHVMNLITDTGLLAFED